MTMNNEVNEAISVICSAVGVDPCRTLEKRNRRVDMEYYARLIIAKELCETCQLAHERAGEILNRDRTTIIQMVKVYKDRYETENFFRKMASEAGELVKNRLTCC